MNLRSIVLLTSVWAGIGGLVKKKHFCMGPISITFSPQYFELKRKKKRNLAILRTEINKTPKKKRKGGKNGFVGANLWNYSSYY